jgi:putative restriction endonuclease
VETDSAIRLAAFARLEELTRLWPDGVPAAEIRRGFTLGDRVFPFRAQQGIFRPKEMHGGALSISTVVPTSGPPRYDDEIASDESFFVYRYRDNGPQSHDNRLLRTAYREQTPVIYFRGIAPGLYDVLWPCFITHDDPMAGLVHVQVGVAALDATELRSPEVERRYVMRAVRQRLHQHQFRRMVLRAYRDRCTVCRLHETRLLQAAHIVPDRDVRGLAEVPNGLSLCSIHHGAFDANLLGIRPDLSVQLSRRLLEDDDGPMLEQGLKAFHGARITLPRRPADHPDRDYLEERYATFRAAA